MTFDAGHIAPQEIKARYDASQSDATDIRRMARTAIAETRDQQEAVDRLFAIVQLNDAVSDFLLKEGCRRVVQELMSRQRASLAQPFDLSDASGERIAAMIRNTGSAYDWPLPGGLRLGDATLKEIAVARDFHAAQRDGHQTQFLMYDKLMKRMKNAGGKTVREVIAESDLRRLQEKSK